MFFKWASCKQNKYVNLATGLKHFSLFEMFHYLLSCLAELVNAGDYFIVVQYILKQVWLEYWNLIKSPMKGNWSNRPDNKCKQLWQLWRSVITSNLYWTQNDLLLVRVFQCKIWYTVYAKPKTYYAWNINDFIKK